MPTQLVIRSTSQPACSSYRNETIVSVGTAIVQPGLVECHHFLSKHPF